MSARPLHWPTCKAPWHDHCDASSASHQAACFTRSAAPDEALPSLIRETRPLSVCSETRFKPSFLRTTPARKPRTECCCHSVAVMIAAIVAPAGVRSIARMRACLVPGRVEVFGDECADREPGLDLLVVRATVRVEALDFDFDLDFLMGSSKLCDAVRRITSAPPGQNPGRARLRSAHSPLQSHHSNAPIEPVSQSNLSKKVALLIAIAARIRSVRSAFRRTGRLLLGPHQRRRSLSFVGRSG